MSIKQLQEAFKDDLKGALDQLGNPRSVCHRMLTSPFFTKMVLTHNTKDKMFFDELRDNYMTNEKPSSSYASHVTPATEIHFQSITICEEETQTLTT